ncbi:MAG: pectate lyase [Bacteroidetes bacterium]|nr:pectate lyase [Bacteroidota bacterium]
MNIRMRHSFFSLLYVFCTVCFSQIQPPTKNEVLHALKIATRFFDENINSEGRFVWCYTLDGSRRWGEMEAYPTMAWLQGQGTVQMGETFLDLYESTHDHYYLHLAFKVARVVIDGQLNCGGWNYMIDAAGEESLRRWYETIGKNGWRLEEFHHYYGNATFDDGVTYNCGMFLLRLEILKPTPEVRGALEKLVKFVKESQYPIGAWPQRYPHPDSLYKAGYPLYPRYYTFNDDVTFNNIRFLLVYYKLFGDTTVVTYIKRGMDFYILSQLPPPQAGWAMQYSFDLRPVAARSYEPASLDPIVTGKHIEALVKFYEVTGCRTYLDCIPPAIHWLESVVLEKQNGSVVVPKFVEVGSNEPLFTHRRGSNVRYGRYYFDKSPENTLIHYRSTRFLALDLIKEEYKRICTTTIPLRMELSIPSIDTLHDSVRKFHALRSYLTLPSERLNPKIEVSSKEVLDLVTQIQRERIWSTQHAWISNPYKGDPPTGDSSTTTYSQTSVGDEYDTSPYESMDSTYYITTAVYIRNVRYLLEYLKKSQN